MLVLLAPAAAARADDADFFERRIRPILTENCFECHSDAGGTTKGGLALDSRDGWRKGGESGPAIVPGDREKSLLLEAVRYAHPEVHMPPRGKLEDAQIEDLAAWVAMGAPDPRDKAPEPAATASRRTIDLEAGRRHWAFLPIGDPLPPAIRESGARDPIDAFILAALEAEGIPSAPECDRRTWLRRVTLDLIGLPPTPEDLAAFEADASPHSFEKVVDRLLASPHHGERWGRMWLDLVRYSDSNGVDENLAYASAWRYRDYVVRSLNEDKPFDRFVTEQLAGDLLPESDTPEQLRDQLVATGFLVLGPKMLAEQDKEKLAVDTVDEQIDVVSKAFLGVTLSCARCHDHKFDPFLQKDYYALAGIFRSTSTFEDLGFLSRWRERELASKSEIAARDRWRADRESAEKALTAARELGQTEWRKGAAGELSRAVAALESTSQGAMLIEAEDFRTSNLRVDHESYGNAEIGVIHTHQGGQQFAEYAIELPAIAHGASGAKWTLEIRYAMQESRPLRVLVNGSAVNENALAEITGGGDVAHRKWTTVATFDAEGPIVLRLERPESQPQHFPHVDSLLLRPAFEDATVPWPPPAAIGAIDPQLARSVAEWLARRAPRDAVDRASEVSAALASATDPAAPLADASLDDARKRIFSWLGPLPPSLVPDDASLPPESRAAIERGKSDLTALDARKPPEFDRALAVADDKAVEMPVHVRGSHLNKEAATEPRGVPALFDPIRRLEPIPEGASGRLEFARWICADENPLTARVIANRIWQGHFGTGLVATASNWGIRGEPPSHPELLDHLARSLVRGSWSLKALHRRIVLSSTYRRSSLSPATSVADESDPENRLLARFPRRRLDAEQIRDSMLAVSGTLDAAIGGSLLATKDREYVTNDQSSDKAQYSAPRRTLYLPVIRNAMYEYLATFDYADPSTSLEKRPESVVASQALWLLNSPFAIEASSALATRATSDANADVAARIARAWSLALLRMPSSTESERAIRFVAAARELLPESPDRDARAFAAYCQTLFASSEFLYVD